MFTKVQLTVQVSAQVFLKLYFFNRAIIKVQWRVWYLFHFMRKNNLLRLFVGIMIESHFPLIYPSIYFVKVTIQIIVADSFILFTEAKMWNIVYKEPCMLWDCLKDGLYKSNITMGQG